MSVGIKCVTVGNGANGKTCLNLRYAVKEYPKEYVPTVMDNFVVDLDINGTKVKLDPWDTAGGEDWPRPRPLSYPGTDFFLICFAVDDRYAFDSVEEEWYPELHHHCPKVLKYLVCTKVDLRTQEVEGVPKGDIVSFEEGSDLAKKLGVSGYMECSALTGDGVNDVFNKAVEECLIHQMVKKKNKEKCLLI